MVSGRRDWPDSSSRSGAGRSSRVRTPWRPPSAPPRRRRRSARPRAGRRCASRTPGPAGRVAAEQAVDPRKHHPLGAGFVEQRQAGIGQAARSRLPTTPDGSSTTLRIDATVAETGETVPRAATTAGGVWGLASAGRWRPRRRSSRRGGGARAIAGRGTRPSGPGPRGRTATTGRWRRPRAAPAPRGRPPGCGCRGRWAQRQRAVAVDLDGAVVQARGPARAEALGDARRHPGLEPGEAHRPLARRR